MARYAFLAAVLLVAAYKHIKADTAIPLWSPRNQEYINVSSALHRAGMNEASEVLFLWPSHDYFYDVSDPLRRPFTRWMGERETLDVHSLEDALSRDRFRFLIVEPPVASKYPRLTILLDPSQAPVFLRPLYVSDVCRGLVVYEFVE